MERYLVLKIDGKFAVQREHTGVASFRDTEADAIRLAFILLRENGGKGRERLLRRLDETIEVWLEE